MADQPKKPTAVEMFAAANIETVQLWIQIIEESDDYKANPESFSRFLSACRLRVKELEHKQLFNQNVKIIR